MREKWKPLPINVGDVLTNKEGCEYTVIEYNAPRDIIIKYNDVHGFEAKVRSDTIRLGNIRNPYKPRVHGVGYIGSGKYKLSKTDKVITKCYDAWHGMLGRCYCPKNQIKQPTYVGCTVHPDWHNFQVFADWYFSQEFSLLEGYHLDKDILKACNKVYSAETCCLVPSEVNVLFTDTAGKRGEWPIGVGYDKYGKFRAYIRMYGKLKHLGMFETAEIAYQVHKKAKEAYVKEVANLYRSKNMITEEVYNALMAWTLDYRYYKEEN